MKSVARLEVRAAALNDMRGIWRYSADRWGVEQAERYTTELEQSFETIVAMPEIGREHTEFDPPVRIFPSAEHLIVYVVRETEVSVLRVFSARQDWREMLG